MDFLPRMTIAVLAIRDFPGSLADAVRIALVDEPVADGFLETIAGGG